MDQTADIPIRHETSTEALSPWWWLYLPVVVAAGLVGLFQFDHLLYERWFDGEQGILELTQFALLVVATILALRILMLPQTRKLPWLMAWVGVATLGTAYTAGEELSWAQHFVGWSTPEWWASLNDQGETNLHNTSSWLDQKPRALLEIGVVMGGIVLPLLMKALPRMRQSAAAIIIPPLAFLPLAVIAELTRIGERARELFGSQPEIVFRPSEVQEFFFFWFVLLYVIVLYRRIANTP